MARLGRRQPNRPIVRHGPAGTRTPPPLIAYSETTWAGNGAKSTGSVSWQTGDRIVVIAIGSSQFGVVPDPTATGLTFTAGTAINQASTSWMNSWTATAGSNGSGTIDSTGQTISGAWGMSVWVWRGSDGFGSRVADATTSKTASLARSQDESAVVIGIGDTNAGSTSGYAWTPTISNEREVQANANHTVYVGDWVDQDAAGTTSYGITGVAGSGNYAKIAIEILGAPASGATDYTQTITDSIGILDSQTQASTFDRSQTDAVGILDSQSQVAAFSQTQTDNVGILDSQTQVAAFTQTQTDNVGILDAATQASAFVRSQTDNVGLLDSASQAAAFSQTVTDSVGILDSQTQVLGGTDHTRTITDTIGILDAASQQSAFDRTQTDPVGITDSISTRQDKTLTDTIGITDFGTTSDLAITVTDPVGITDTAQQAAAFVRAQTDNVGLLDSAAQATSFDRIYTDPVGLLDSQGQVSAIFRSQTDNIGILDSTSQSFSGILSYTITDTIGILDAANQQSTFTRSQTDNLGITYNLFTSRERELTDSISLLDNTAQTAAFIQALTDSVGITDPAQQLAAFTRSYTDNIGLLDSLAQTTAFDRQFTDAVGLLDAATRIAAIQRLLTDIVGITDSTDVVATLVGVDYMTTVVPNNMTITELLTVFRTLLTKEDVTGVGHE